MAAHPPVVRGEFVYRDVLLVDVGGELKRHPRASEAELKALLNGKNVAKDQVGHWWEAQLIHYGLQRSKQKDTAKVRLSQALAQGKLKTQPPHLADMEAQMKKEYAAAVRKAAKLSTPAVNKGAKRGREEESKSSSQRTKVSVRVGDVSVDIDHGDVVPAKKQKKTVSSTKATAAPKKAIASSATKASSKIPATPKASKQQQQQLEKSSFSNDNVFQRSGSNPKPSPAVKPKAAPEPKVKREPAASSQAPARPKPSVKREGYLFDENAMDTRVDMPPEKWEITGVYSVYCPQITEQLPEEEQNLRLFIEVNVESGITWGGFELVMKSGVIKMDEVDFNRRLSFGWRAKDSWDDTLRFGKKCFGEIEFDGMGGVRGVFHSMFNEPCEFTGKRRPGPRWSGKSVYKYEQEWNDFPKQAYGR